MTLITTDAAISILETAIRENRHATEAILNELATYTKPREAELAELEKQLGDLIYSLKILRKQRYVIKGNNDGGD